MNRIYRNLSIALRAERLIAQRKMKVVRTQAGLMAAAGIVAGIGLIMLNVAAYFALTTKVSPQLAALIVALANFVIAIVLGVYASRINADSDVRVATEVRDMAIEDIETEVDDATHAVKEVVEDVRQLVKNPLGSALPSVVGPLASALLKSGRK
jgi:hypothetical protein